MIWTFLVAAGVAVLVFAAARGFYRRPPSRVAPDYEREMTYLELDARELINARIHCAEVEARIMKRIHKLPPNFVEAGAQLVQLAQGLEAHGRKMLGAPAPSPEKAPEAPIAVPVEVPSTNGEAKGISMASMRWRGN